MSGKMASLGLTFGGANLLSFPPSPAWGRQLPLGSPPGWPRGTVGEREAGHRSSHRVPVPTHTLEGQAPNQRASEEERSWHL